MKVFSLLALCLGVSLARANDPAAAALDFLEKVRTGQVDLSPGKDTALSPYTTGEKRDIISRRLQRMASDLGGGSLEATEVKVDDNLAAVLVRSAGGFDPSRIRVVAVGLVKVKNLWLPAPVPASFENTSSSLLSQVRERAQALESWMLGGQAAELEQLRERAQERMRREIRAAMDPEILRSDDPEKVAMAFLAACARHDLPATLGFLGGLQQNPPVDWPDRLRSADTALTAGENAQWPWRLVMAPEVVRVRVHDAGEIRPSLFSFGCLDPAGTGLEMNHPRVEILHLELSRDSEGLWKVDLPPMFLLAPGETEDEAEDDFDRDLLDAFAGEVRKKIPASPAPDMAAAANSLADALRANRLDPLLALMDLDGDPGTAGRGCAAAAAAWWLLRNPSAPRHSIPLGFHEEGDRGVASFQFFSPRESDKLDVRSFYFEKSAGGWLLMPGLRPTNSPSENEAAAKQWVTTQTAAWRRNWQEKILGDSPVLEKIIEGNAPSAEDARRLAGQWLSVTASGDIAQALALTTSLQSPAAISRTLKNLGYDIQSASQGAGSAEVIFAEKGETWAVAGVKFRSGSSTIYPLYLSLSTPAGPRLLIGTSLFANTSSGREFLNNEEIRRLKDVAGAPALDELRRLIDSFNKVAREN